jgi:large subunit ribosomal protein L9
MKLLLLKDVYKLGQAGDVKKVAPGYGRNYLIPQGLAVLATPGAMKNAERIRAEANKRRAILNQELGGLAEQLKGQTFTFPVRASETGKLYGSVTTRMISSAINEKLETDISHRQVDGQPIRNLGEFSMPVRLTIDLAPEITVIVYREGEGIESAYMVEEIEEAEEAPDADALAAETEMEAGTEEEPAVETEVEVALDEENLPEDLEVVEEVEEVEEVEIEEEVVEEEVVEEEVVEEEEESGEETD